jgi:hypothetical protein
VVSAALEYKQGQLQQQQLEQQPQEDNRMTSVGAQFRRLQPDEGARVLEGYFLRIVEQRERELALLHQQEDFQQQVKITPCSVIHTLTYSNADCRPHK